MLSGQVRTDGGNVPPLTVSWGFTPNDIQGIAAVEGVQRANSYT